MTTDAPWTHGRDPAAALVVEDTEPLPDSVGPGRSVARAEPTPTAEASTPQAATAATALRFPPSSRFESMALPPAETLTQFNVTPLQPCPYLDGQLERKIWTELSEADVAKYGVLSRGGFRRSHRIAYRPACPSCNACRPVRVVAERFHWTRSMRRVRNVNADLSVRAIQPHAAAEQFALFNRYLSARHGDGEMAGMSFLEYRWMVEDSPGASEILEFRAPRVDGRRGDLIAACLIDRLDDGLSAVYSFYDPDHGSRSLGTYMILWMVMHARELQLPFVYLGYWIAGSPKMDYKRRFTPTEELRHGTWVPLD